ncbi:MAG: hypothetical protein F6K16_41830 [Symploca sp. SIO2B6]|nr:hypothetical protein [Symploca sp. SIO2B6]
MAIARFNNASTLAGPTCLWEAPQPAPDNTPREFKYSRLFAIGLLTAIETIDESIVAEQETLKPWVQKLSELLHLPNEKMEKDLEIYRSNLEKFRQAQVVMEDVLKADRKKREERQAAAQEASDTPSDDVVGSESAPDGGEATP